jgi:large repetitive protein
MRFPRILVVTLVAAAVIVPTALALRFTDESYNLPQGVVGQPYSHWFAGAGGCGPALPYQFRVITGGLPPGLSLGSDGHVSGTPTQGGSWSFWVELSDEDPPSASWCVPAKSQREFTVNVVAGTSPVVPPLVVTTPSAPPAAVGVGYSLTLAASGGGSQTWSVTSGQLPSGVALASNGVLSGTPTAAGTFTFTVTVSDGTRSGSKQFTLAVAPALSISTPSTPPATVGTAYSVGLVASGGGSQTWSVTSGQLPGGVALASNGALSGTPTAAGTYIFTVTVSDGTRSSSKQFTLAVREPLAITVPATLPRAEVGQLKAIRLAFVATGGSGTNTWVLQGTLPPGLTFTPAAKQTTEASITGRPTAAGSFPIKLVVTDSEGRTAAVDVPFIVSPAIGVATTRLPVARVGRLFAATLKAVGGVTPTTWSWKKIGGPPLVGLRLTRTTGTIAGIPRTAGVYRMRVEVTDALGVKARTGLVLTIKRARRIS